MQYISTRHSNEKVSFKEAVLNGLSKNGGLYIPENIPQLPSTFFDKIQEKSQEEIASLVLKPYVHENITNEKLTHIILETLSFPFPLIQIENSIFSLELFHGPTQAFKDVGARFLSRCISHFKLENQKQTVVLVATSGDTGGAVANGFYNVPNASVIILFPKGKVSPYQEYQMTSLGKNIQPIEIDGTFDDCQKLVKQSFEDEQLKAKYHLSSANSINIARLLPQMLYYFFAYQQIKEHLDAKKLIISVPSGNLGNLTAGLMAKHMNLPVHQFISSHNANKTFPDFINTGNYSPRPSVHTLANAMDIGSPSNYERIDFLYNKDWNKQKQDILVSTFNDSKTLHEINNCFYKNNYLLDPHGAIGKLGLQEHLKEDAVGIFIATAHPRKFSHVINMAIKNHISDDTDLSKCHKTPMNNNFEDLKSLLMG